MELFTAQWSFPKPVTVTRFSNFTSSTKVMLLLHITNSIYKCEIPSVIHHVRILFFPLVYYDSDVIEIITATLPKIIIIISSRVIQPMAQSRLDRIRQQQPSFLERTVDYE